MTIREWCHIALASLFFPALEVWIGCDREDFAIEEYQNSIKRQQVTIPRLGGYDKLTWKRRTGQKRSDQTSNKINPSGRKSIYYISLPSKHSRQLSEHNFAEGGHMDFILVIFHPFGKSFSVLSPPHFPPLNSEPNRSFQRCMHAAIYTFRKISPARISHCTCS